MPLTDRPFGPYTPAANSATQSALNVSAVPQSGPSGPLPVTQSITSSSEALIETAYNSSVALTCQVEPDTNIEQSVFDFWTSGIVKTTSTTNLTLKVYEGAAISSGNLLGSSGTVAQNGTTGSPVTAAFYSHVQAIFDSVSGVLAGTIEFYINKTNVAKVTFSNFVGGFNNTGNPSATPPTAAVLPEFCMSVTSSGATTGAPTTVNVQKFSCG